MHLFGLLGVEFCKEYVFLQLSQSIKVGLAGSIWYGARQSG